MFASLAESYGTSLNSDKPTESHGLFTNQLTGESKPPNIYTIRIPCVPKTIPSTSSTTSLLATFCDLDAMTLQLLPRETLEAFSLYLLERVSRGQSTQLPRHHTFQSFSADLEEPWGGMYSAVHRNARRLRCSTLRQLCSIPPATASTSVTVRRENTSKQVPWEDVRVGDVVFLHRGDTVLADVVLLSMTTATEPFFVTSPLLHGVLREFPRTVIADAKCSLYHPANIVPSGFTITAGEAVGVVAAVGPNTSLGKMCAGLHCVERLAPPPSTLSSSSSSPLLNSIGDVMSWTSSVPFKVHVLDKVVNSIFLKVDVWIVEQEVIPMLTGYATGRQGSVYRVHTAYCAGYTTLCTTETPPSTRPPSADVVPPHLAQTAASMKEQKLLITAFQTASDVTRAVPRKDVHPIQRFVLCTALALCTSKTKEAGVDEKHLLALTALRSYVMTTFSSSVHKAQTEFTQPCAPTYVPRLKLWASLHKRTNDTLEPTLLILHGNAQDVYSACSYAVGPAGIIKTNNMASPNDMAPPNDFASSIGFAVMEFSPKMVAKQQELDLTSYLRQMSEVVFAGSWHLKTQDQLEANPALSTFFGRKQENVRVDVITCSGSTPEEREHQVEQASLGNTKVVGYCGGNLASATALKRAHVGFAVLPGGKAVDSSCSFQALNMEEGVGKEVSQDRVDAVDILLAASNVVAFPV
eukprot:PhF_6_TR613/c0_g1_i1/m.794